MVAWGGGGRWISASRHQNTVGKGVLQHGSDSMNWLEGFGVEGAHREGPPRRWRLCGGAHRGWCGQEAGEGNEGVTEVHGAGFMLGEVTAGLEMAGSGLSAWGARRGARRLASARSGAALGCDIKPEARGTSGLAQLAVYRRSQRLGELVDVEQMMQRRAERACHGAGR
jgi:hypothetical protein